MGLYKSTIRVLYTNLFQYSYLFQYLFWCAVHQKFSNLFFRHYVRNLLLFLYPFIVIVNYYKTKFGF